MVEVDNSDFVMAQILSVGVHFVLYQELILLFAVFVYLASND